MTRLNVCCFDFKSLTLSFRFIATVSKIIYVRKMKVEYNGKKNSSNERTFRAQIRVLLFVLVVSVFFSFFYIPLLFYIFYFIIIIF
jgi:hypothetical protein